MLDPLTAIGLASNIVQFVDFGAKILSTGRELHQSESGATVKNLEIEAMTLHLTGLVGQLLKHSLDSTGFQRRKEQSPAEKSLRGLAEICENIARELIKTLGSIKKEKSGHAWISVYQALRSVWAGDKIDSLRSRLVAIRDEISFHLLSALSEGQEKLAKTLADIRANTEAQKTKLGSINRNLREENRDMKRDIISAIYDQGLRPGNYQHIYQISSMLSEMANEDKMSNIEQRMLHSLNYSRMRERGQRVATAHEGTFEWVFEDVLAGRKRWSNLSYWLEKQNGLYWVNGKAGAGKSTFMKWLQGHLQTRQKLSRWADGNPLVTAGFYFWSAGTYMQKSQTGLLQSLLHEIVRQFPKLLPTVLPLRWHSYTLFGADLHPWTLPELLEAFEMLITESTRTHRFCFFIDGLDEFDGKHGDIIKVLKHLAAVPNIKICASSRPWNIFLDAFAHYPTLLLHELTVRDIEVYVRTELSNSPHFKLLEKAEPERAPQFISEIVNRSSGVFLWVHFATTSLKEGLTDADRLEDLEKRLEGMPTDLEDFFVHILKGVDENHFQQATQLFRLVLENPPPLPLLTLSYFDEKDPDFAINMEIRPLDAAQARLRCDAIERRVNSRCKGLLEVHNQTSSSRSQELIIDAIASSDTAVLDQDGKEVDFLHRTVRDFLKTPTTRIQLVAKDDDSFKASIIMLQALLASLKTVNRLKTRTLNVKQIWKFMTPAIILARTSETVDSVRTVSLLKELDRTASILYAEALTNRRSQGLEPRQSSPRPRSPWEPIIGSHWSNTQLSKGEPSWSDPSWTSFLTFAVENGLESYVNYRFTQERDLLSKLRGPPLLLMTFAKAECYQDQSHVLTYHKTEYTPNPGMMRLLLEHGADPNQYFSGHTIWERLLFRSKHASQNEELWKEACQMFRRYGADISITEAPRLLQDDGAWIPAECEDGFEGEEDSHDLEERIDRLMAKWDLNQENKMEVPPTSKSKEKKKRLSSLFARWNHKKTSL